MVKLAGVILALSIEVLVGVIFAQLLKATSREKMAWLGFYRFIAATNLHCLARSIYLRVLALAKKLRGADIKARGQRPADAEIGALRSGGQRDQA